LDAARLRIARVGEAAVDGGSLSLKATKTGDELSLDRLSVAGLGGAAVEVRGAAGRQGRWLTLRVDAEKLRDFAALAARVAPGRLSRLLLERAEALSPAKLTLEARASGPGAIGDFAVDTVKGQGSAGQTRFTLAAERSREAAGGAASFAIEAPESGALLRQIGVKSPPAPSGPARIEGSANGRWSDGFDARVAASIAGADFAWRGRLKPDVKSDDDAVLFGAATLKTANAAPLSAAFGLGAPVASPATPVDLAADVVLRGAELGFPRLSGTVAGVKIGGQLRWRPAIEPVAAAAIDPDVALAQSIAGEAQTPTTAQIDGDLALDHASLPALLSLPLGVAAPPPPGAKWSDAPFAPPLVSPPSLELRVKIGALDLADGLPARGATARVRMDAGMFAVDDFAMDVAGGRAWGNFALRRDGAVATLNGKAWLAAVAVDRAALRGRFDASFVFASTGRSASALMSGLAGEGRIDAAGLAIPRLDPGALGRVLAKAQASEAGVEPASVAQALGDEFDKQPLIVPDGTAAVVMNGGVVHVEPLDLAEKSGRASLSADFDLPSQNLTIRATFAEAAGGKFWSGAPPSVAVALTGSLDAPTRQIDPTACVAGLAAQAIARESDRIAAFEEDIRERAYFNRRLKAEQFMRRRAAELAAWTAEQARIRAEQERKRPENETLKASEPPQPTTPPAAVGAAVSTPAALAPKPKADQPDPTASGLY